LPILVVKLIQGTSGNSLHLNELIPIKLFHGN